MSVGLKADPQAAAHQLHLATLRHVMDLLKVSALSGVIPAFNAFHCRATELVTTVGVIGQIIGQPLRGGTGAIVREVFKSTARSPLLE